MTQAIQDLRIVCRRCGKPEPDYWPTKRFKDLCWSCSFWQEYVGKKDRMDIARINGNHYVIGIEASLLQRGHGGKQFTIQFLDGRKVTTTNLWSQGEIPPEFRTELPDNARFV